VKRFVALIALSASFACTFAAQAGTLMTHRGPAFAPPAFSPFCAREPRLCSTSGGKKVVTLQPELSAELKQVNRAVNSRIKERNDTGDDWRVPVTSGGLRGFRDLEEARVAEAWLASLGTVLTVARYRGQGHTVLTVRTSEGDLILDNLTSSVRDWSSTPYSYFARQAQRQWQELGADWRRQADLVDRGRRLAPSPQLQPRRSSRMVGSP
jgi:predicted transglutaminase-like cysteine proteinase